MSKELEDAFKKFRSRDVDTFPAKVVSVDKIRGTCKVKEGELEYTDVQLSATVEENGKRFFLSKGGEFRFGFPNSRRFTSALC